MPHRIRYLSGAGAILLLLLAGWWASAAQAGAGLRAAPPGPLPEPQRERSGDPSAPQISFIDSAVPTCNKPLQASNNCYITWSYLSVTAASSQYIISMTVTIDGKVQASHAGFFQTSMYVPGEAYGSGFRVPCGASGVSGVPNLGQAYSYAIRARETGGLKAANYGTVLCPAGVLRVFLPVVPRLLSVP